LFDEKTYNKLSHLSLQKHYEFSDLVGDANRATVATVDKQCGHTKSKETEKFPLLSFISKALTSNAEYFLI
jgi:hypothetical protein